MTATTTIGGLYLVHCGGVEVIITTEDGEEILPLFSGHMKARKFKYLVEDDRDFSILQIKHEAVNAFIRFIKDNKYIAALNFEYNPNSIKHSFDRILLEDA